MVCRNIIILDIKEYISSGIIESYVLGLVSDQERREVECMSKIYPELREHLREVQGNFEHIANTWQKEPPADLKNKVMARISEEEKKSSASSFAKKRAKVIRMQNARNGRGINAKSVAAASVILVLAAGALFFVKNNELKKAQAELTALNEEVKAKEAIEEELNKKVEEYDDKQAFITDDRTKTIALAGTPNSPEAKVKAYWNENRGEVMLMGIHLPQHEIDKQYQLLAIVDGKPVDLGMLDESNPNTSLTKKVNVNQVQAFAITLERKGGSPTPTMDQMYVIGNV